MAQENNETVLALTADIVAAHLSNNTVAVSDVPALIRQVHGALTGIGQEPEAPKEEPQQQPAVPIRSSVKPDYIVCLEDGKKLKMLRRYLRTRFNMSPEDYRTKWKLAANYPMVAPNYTEQRRNLANSIGLGRKRAAPADTGAAEPKRRGRKPAAKPGAKPTAGRGSKKGGASPSA